MKRWRLIPVLIGVLATFVAAAPAQAAEPINVDTLGCPLFFGGKQLVDSNTDINLKSYWASATRRQGLKFLEAVRPVVKIDGVLVPHPNIYWAVPEKLDDNLWRTTWTYPAGQLSSGEYFVVAFQLKLRERVWDGTRWYKAGKVFDEALVCKVKAT